jgi:hypothetical protein
MHCQPRDLVTQLEIISLESLDAPPIVILLRLQASLLWYRDQAHREIRH